MKEEQRLNHTVLREKFAHRSYLLQHWQQLLEQGLSAAGLIEFLAIHKYLVKAHTPAASQRMGSLLSDILGKEINAISESYINNLALALKRRVKRKWRVNLLQHIMSYLKCAIDSNDRQHRGLPPLRDTIGGSGQPATAAGHTGFM
ncbi:MAG: YbgA family protein [Candidatus Thiodiazotropha sp. (ex. Lucinisca nassula)]|nr:YbgA family protein [Candidatus Thiodiazotropha sp. (ex. Lucinisca nassula)]